MGQVATLPWPDGQQRDRVEPAEGNQRVERRQEGLHADLVHGRGIREGRVDAAGEDGDGEGDEAGERDQSELVMRVEEGLEGGLKRELGGV